MLVLALSVAAMPTFEWATDNAQSLSDHKRFGFDFGTKFKDVIQKRFAAKRGLARMLVEQNTTRGKALYDAFVDLHERAHPLAMAELRGLADGAELSFAEVFLQNIPQEYGACSPALPKPAVDGCSDVMTCSNDGHWLGLCAVAHNEDNQAEDRGAVVLVTARFGTAKWVAATYAGELPTGAFGFSKTGGFGFTMNWVGPSEPACPVERAKQPRASLTAARVPSRAFARR